MQVFENLNQKNISRNNYGSLNKNDYVSYLQRTKLFIDFDSELLHRLYKEDITGSAKILFMYLVSLNARNKKAYFLTTYKQILEEIKTTEQTLYKNIKLLEEKSFITKTGKNRKGIWKISIVNDKNIIRDKSKNYPQESEKNFVSNIKKCVALTKKSMQSYININNKDKENKTIVVENTKIVDKPFNPSKINVNEVIFKNIEEKNLDIVEKVFIKEKFKEENPIDEKTSFNLTISSIKKSLINKFGSTFYKSWFSKIKFDEIKDTQLCARVPNQFIKDYIVNNYDYELLSICKAHSMLITNINISVDQSLANISDYYFEIDEQLHKNQNTFEKLTKEQEVKVKNYASKLCAGNLRKGYSATLKKDVLTAQIIHHLSTWRPTKISDLSPEQSFDISLSVAYKKIKEGTWSTPIGFEKNV